MAHMWSGWLLNACTSCRCILWASLLALLTFLILILTLLSSLTFLWWFCYVVIARGIWQECQIHVFLTHAVRGGASSHAWWNDKTNALTVGCVFFTYRWGLFTYSWGLFTYGRGAGSKEDQTQFPNGGNRKQTRPNLISGRGGEP